MTKTKLQQLNELPKEIQESVKYILKAYDEVYVTFEYGKYDVSVGICIKSKYGKDHKFIGTFKAEDIFTEEERYKNYKETFGDEYDGKLKGYDSK